jgi:hypothetical protein
MGKDISDENRLEIFLNRHQLYEDPWAIPWDTPLACVWQSRKPPINEEKAKLPEGFRMLGELHPSLAPLDKLISFIEEGGHTVEEIEVILHCAISEVLAIEKTSSHEQAALAKSAFCDEAARILGHFKTGISVQDTLALHES